MISLISDISDLSYLSDLSCLFDLSYLSCLFDLSNLCYLSSISPISLISLSSLRSLISLKTTTRHLWGRAPRSPPPVPDYLPWPSGTRRSAGPRSGTAPAASAARASRRTAAKWPPEAQPTAAHKRPPTDDTGHERQSVTRHGPVTGGRAARGGIIKGRLVYGCRRFVVLMFKSGYKAGEQWNRI